VSRALEGDALVVATHNAGKARELAELLEPHLSRVLAASELDLPEPEESEETFVGNAALKAVAAARASGLPALADDSGLVVPALGGEPGVRSARWAGRGRDFSSAMRAVQEQLGERDRRAQMVCALALAWPDGHVEVFEGRVDGELVWPPRGQLGFGYEPMFRPVGSPRTYGEMPRPEKHADDPRARAFERLSRECLRSAQRQ